jgi:hypothetical protein
MWSTLEAQYDDLNVSRTPGMSLYIVELPQESPGVILEGLWLFVFVFFEIWIYYATFEYRRVYK